MLSSISQTEILSIIEELWERVKPKISPVQSLLFCNYFSVFGFAADAFFFESLEVAVEHYAALKMHCYLCPKIVVFGD